MTDKEKIIIDGVNVSECKYLHKSIFNENAHLCDCAINVFQNCLNTPNCYYKQLQRKTAECEKYEQALDSIVATIKDLENEDIVTFPDFSLKENCKIIMSQCNKGYVDILNIINKAKDGSDE